MDWEDVRLFLAIARGTTLIDAATRLGVSHSTVSRRLAALEASARVPLFARSSNGYAITEAGRSVQESALKMEAEYLALSRKMAAHDSFARQRVRVSAPDVLACQLAPQLVAFRRAAAQIILEIDIDNSPVDLDRLEADVVLRASRAPDPHLVGTRVAYTAWAVYVAKTKRKPNVDDEHLSWIGFGANLASLPVARWMRENVAEERIAIRTNSTLAAQSYARAGLGAACLWCLAGDSDPELLRLTGPLRDVASDLWLLTHPDLQRSRGIAKVRSFLAQTIRAQRSRIEGRESAVVSQRT